MQTRIMSLMVVAAGAFASSAQTGGGGGGFGTYIPDRHDRFLDTGETNPNFWANTFDLSGVSLSSRAVLISDRHVLSAYHVMSGPGTLEFLNADGERHEFRVEHVERIESLYSRSDISIGRLEQAVPEDAGLAIYPIDTEDAFAVNGREMLVYGKANTAGRNVAENRQLMGVTGRGSTYSIRFDFDPDEPDEGFGDDEKRYIGGDSGSPAFFVNPDKGLTLVGAAYAIFGSGQSMTAHAGTYIDDIEAIAERDGVTLPTEPVILGCAPIDPDWNEDGVTDGADLTLFLGDLQANVGSADIDCSGEGDTIDALAYLGVCAFKVQQLAAADH